MSIKYFLQRFPEFEDTEAKLLEMALSEAQSEMNRNYWGELFDVASLYLAAHKLAISPMGEPSRLDGMAEKNVYQLEYERLCRSAFLGARVI
jgi:hypothetical protein